MAILEAKISFLFALKLRAAPSIFKFCFIPCIVKYFLFWFVICKYGAKMILIKKGVIMNLAPEILKMRDALLERIKGKSLREVSEIINEILLNETNNVNRLAALSARVQTLREFHQKRI